MSTCEVIGIDLGTTYSCVGVFKNKKIEVIANEEGSRLTPSEVAFTPDEQLVGQAAKDQGHKNPENTVYNVKRLIGRKFDEPDVQKDIKNFQYCVLEKDSRPIIEVEHKGKKEQITPEQVSGSILQKLKISAEKYLGHKVTDAVITVPAYFNDAQRQATKDAATIAGLNAIRILNEPTAAAMAFGFDNSVVGVQNVFVFDLGGGTFDVSILRISEGPSFEVLATTGDTHLGGIDFDQRLFDHFAAEFKAKHGLDVKSNSRAVKKLLKACENVKVRLSNAFDTSIEVDGLMEGHDFYSEIKRARLDDLCAELFNETIKKSEQALKDANLNKSDIDCVVLVGGSTRIPKIQKIVKDFFDGKELRQSVNADESVAYGAAVQAAFLSGLMDTQIKNIRLHDVTPLSLGVETGYENAMSVVIERNTRVPATASKTFTNTRDNQKSVRFEIYEGERASTRDNNKLGAFSLDDIPRAPAETLIFDVTFSIDANGILSVSATERSTGKKNFVKITNERGRLPPETIDRMVEEAKKFEKEDSIRREKNQTRGEMETYAYSVRDALEKNRNSLNAGEAEKAGNAWKESVGWINSNPKAEKKELDSKFAKLKNDCGPLLEKMKK